MKKTFVLVAVLVVFASALAVAAPRDANQARKVVRGWLKKTQSKPMNVNLGEVAKRIDTFADSNGQSIYHIVYLNPSGYVVVPADDEVEPIVGFSSEGEYDPSPKNPMGALVSADMADRVTTAHKEKHDPANPKHAPFINARSKWQNLESLDDANLPLETTHVHSVSDVRVSPLVLSKWDQSNECGDLCYNYYTPNNYYCGCVATAMAQLMRFYQYPPSPSTLGPFTIWVDGVSEQHSLMGGNYAWSDSNMVLDPNCSTTLTQRQAIGVLTHDAGVAVDMNYASGGSGADTLMTAQALKDVFGYSKAVKGYNSGSNISENNLNTMLNPNMDAGFPCMLGITGTPGGHAIVCDGYGYDTSTLYHHLNMGWSGSDDAWYDLPSIDTGNGTYTSVYKCVYNVYVTGSGEIISGRVTDSNGNPINDANVTTGGGTYTAVTNAKGIYALAHVPASSSYTVQVTKAGYSFTPINVTTGTSTDYSTSSGNVWGVDFVYTNYTLTVNSSGASDVNISSSTGHGGTTNYTKTVTSGTSVTLTAPASSGGQTFTDWTGDVTSSNQTISFTMNGNKSVTANYTTAVSNDMFANAITISGTSGQTTGSNVGATKESGEPNHAGNSGGASVWWNWTASSNGQMTIDTFGSSFDTLLAVYTGTSFPLTNKASNDDSGGLQSQVVFDVNAGTIYRIAVDGYGGATGNITLNWSLILSDTTPPDPNPMTWSIEPYETSTSSISMTATAASDSSPPVQYEFDFYSSPTGGSGGDDRTFNTSRTYTDSGLGANHQYGYRIRARDSAPAQNTGSYSSISYDYTDIETPSGITFGTITTTSIEAKSTNTPSGFTRDSSGLRIYNTTKGTDSGWKQNNNYWNSGGLSANTQYGFRAKARNGDADETGYCSSAYRYTYANAPGAGSFSNVGESGIQANWTANGNPAGTQYLCENITRGTSSGWTSNTYWNESGLNCGTQYCYQVRAKNADSIDTSPTSLGCQSTLPCPTVTISASAGPNGTVEPNGVFDVNLGQDVTFTAEPNAGYTVDQWFLDGNSVQAGGTTYTLPIVTASHAVYVTFERLAFTVTASADANGSIEPTGEIQVYYGDNRDFNAIPNIGYEVNEWYLDGNNVQTGGNYCLNSITANHTVYVTFKTPAFTVTASSDANGSVQPSSVVVNCGESQDFNAIPNIGYEVNEWFLDGNSVQAGGTTYTLEDVTADHTVYVTFKELAFAIYGYVVEIDGNTAVEGVLIQTDGNDVNTVTDANGFYELWVDYNWSGIVTPEKEGYIFEPNSNTYTEVTQDYNDVNYTATMMTFGISGYVLDKDYVTPINDVNVSAENGGGPWTSRYGGGSRLTDVNGYYEVVVDYNWSGKVVPAKYAYAFEPNKMEYVNVKSDSNDQDYIGTLLTFIISGHIKNSCDVPIAGVLVDANNGGGQNTTDVNGYYEVWVDYNWSGTVTPGKAHYTFDPNSNAYAYVLDDVIDQNYTATNIYDLDCDCTIGYGDLAVIAENWLKTPANINEGDLNNDNIVNFLDFAEFAKHWLEGPIL
jgi:hypothetical protein